MLPCHDSKLPDSWWPLGEEYYDHLLITNEVYVANLFGGKTT
jgi:hypothetical protein